MDWSLSLDSARERLKETWDEGKKALENTASNLTQLADEAEHAVADAEQRALDAAGALADKVRSRLDAPLVKAAFDRTREGVAALAEDVRTGGVAKVVDDAQRAVSVANEGARDAFRPLAAPLKEGLAAGKALVAGDTQGALAHGARFANFAGHVGTPVEVAAFEAYRQAEKKGESGTVAALKAAGEEMLSQANGLNPLYNFGVAGVEAHDGAGKLLLDRDPRAFFEHMTRGATFFAGAVAGVVGLDEASAGTEALSNVARTTTGELETSALAAMERTAMADDLHSLDPALAERLRAAYSKIIDDLRVVNPERESNPGRLQNCLNCGIAGTATLKGSPTTALPGGPVEVGQLVEVYGTRMNRMPSLQAIEARLHASGDGALGLIFIDPHDPKELGHIVHAANREGVVLFADSQLDAKATFPAKADLWLLMVP